MSDAGIVTGAKLIIMALCPHKFTKGTGLTDTNKKHGLNWCINNFKAANYMLLIIH